MYYHSSPDHTLWLHNNILIGENGKHTGDQWWLAEKFGSKLLSILCILIKMNETDEGSKWGPFEEDVFLGTFDSK